MDNIMNTFRKLLIFVILISIGILGVQEVYSDEELILIHENDIGGVYYDKDSLMKIKKDIYEVTLYVIVEGGYSNVRFRYNCRKKEIYPAGYVSFYDWNGNLMVEMGVDWGGGKARSDEERLQIGFFSHLVAISKSIFND